MIEVIPAILENSFEATEKKIRLVEGLVDWVQIDLLDASLMPNRTFADPGAFTGFKTSLKMELHMMVRDPLKFLDHYALNGFKRFYAHVEGDFLNDYIDECYQVGVEVGVAVDGPTPVESIRPYLDNIDCVLILAVDAGFSGRPFRNDAIDKVKWIRDRDPDIPVAVDGAMNDINAAKVVAAGATRINSNSWLFNSPDIKAAIEKLRNLK